MLVVLVVEVVVVVGSVTTVSGIAVEPLSLPVAASTRSVTIAANIKKIKHIISLSV